METYKNYINLNTFDKKVIMLMIDKVKENDNFVFKNLTTDFFENIWNYLSSKKDIDIAETFDTSVPVLYYGGNNKHAIKFLEKSNISKKNMYNKPSEMLITGDKKEFHKFQANNLKFFAMHQTYLLLKLYSTHETHYPLPHSSRQRLSRQLPSYSAWLLNEYSLK